MSVPSFHAVLVGETLAPRFAAVDFGGTGAIAIFAERLVAFGERIDGFVASQEHTLLVWLGADLGTAFQRGLAAAREATAYSSAATHMTQAFAPRPPDLRVLHSHIVTAQDVANAKLAQRLSTMRLIAARELSAILGTFREAIDRAGDRVDPSERERAEGAYAAACAIDLDAAWPKVSFEELAPVRSTAVNQ